MSSRARLAAWLLLAMMSLACDSVSSDSIQRWKNTEKGPGKLEAALRDHGVAPRLRAEAAAALVDIGKSDEVDGAIASLPSADVQAVGTELVPLYAATLSGGSVTKARDARDELYSLREKAEPPLRSSIDAVLLPTLARDLRMGRAAGGRHSIEQMLHDLGPAATPTLLKLLDEPAAPYPAIIDVMAKTADPVTRDQAGASLVRRATGLGELPLPLWRALGSIGGQTATNFLEQKVEKGHERDAVAAAQALQLGPPQPALSAFALKIAGDQRANKAVRDEMFGLLEHVGTPESAEGAIRIIASDPEELVRYRAYETALAVGRSEVIQSALEAFPARGPYKKDDVADFLVKDIQKIGRPAVPAVVRMLGSKSPLARMCAILALEALGTSAEAPAVAKLSGDKAVLPGYAAGSNLGKEATRVAGILQGRVGGGKP